MNPYGFDDSASFWTDGNANALRHETDEAFKQIHKEQAALEQRVKKLEDQLEKLITKSTKICPFCAKKIDSWAALCVFCGGNVREKEEEEKKRKQQEFE